MEDVSATMITSLRNSLSIMGELGKKYIAGKVAWNDGKRALYNKNVTCLSTCMTDTRVESQDGDFLPFLKTENLNETLGVTDAKNIMFTKSDGTIVTAKDILSNIEEYVGYNGYTNINTKIEENEKLVVRVQTTFIPIKKGETKKIVPSHYSYQTFDANDPNNIIITGTPTGIYGHCDDVGVNKLYGHTIVNGKVNNHYFEAETTNYGIGMHQKREIEKESGSQSTPVSLGFEKMGVSCNTFLVMSFQREQVPEKYLQIPGNYECDEAFSYGTPVYRSCDTTAARMSLCNEIVSQKSRREISVERKKGTPIMLTIHKYYTTEYTSNPEIKTSDVEMAIADMENIYRMCDQHDQLSNLPVMHEDLTKKVVETFKKKNKDDPLKDACYFV